MHDKRLQIEILPKPQIVRNLHPLFTHPFKWKNMNSELLPTIENPRRGIQILVAASNQSAHPWIVAIVNIIAPDNPSLNAIDLLSSQARKESRKPQQSVRKKKVPPATPDRQRERVDSHSTNTADPKKPIKVLN